MNTTEGIADAAVGRTTYDFDADTALVEHAPRRYGGVISDRWNTLYGPDGGYVMALAVRALSQVLPFPDPLTVTAHFLGRATIGEVAIEVETIRQGGRHATGAAQIVQGGKIILSALGTYTNLEACQGLRTDVFGTAPDLPPPDVCIAASDTVPEDMKVSLMKRIEYKAPTVPGWVQGTPTGTPSFDFWIRFADGRPADSASLPLLADAAPPVAFEIGAFGGATVEMTLHFRERPAPGWISCHKETRFLVNGYFEEDCELWDSAGRLVVQSRQLVLLPR